MNKETTPTPEEMKQAFDELRASFDALAQKDEQDQENLIGLYTKMNKIMSKVTYIQKDKRNDHFKYSYASEEAIKKALQSELTVNKVLFLVTNTQVTHREGSQTRLDVQYSFICTDTGARITGSFEGEGNDNADKGIYKALTGAIKYILTSNFLIPTGLDPENDGEEKKPAAVEKKKEPQKPAGKPWLPDKRFEGALAAINNAKSQEELTKIKNTLANFRIKNVHKFTLEEAMDNAATEISLQS